MVYFSVLTIVMVGLESLWTLENFHCLKFTVKLSDFHESPKTQITRSQLNTLDKTLHLSIYLLW